MICLSVKEHGYYLTIFGSFLTMATLPTVCTVPQFSFLYKVICKSVDGVSVFITVEPDFRVFAWCLGFCL